MLQQNNELDCQEGMVTFHIPTLFTKLNKKGEEKKQTIIPFPWKDVNISTYRDEIYNQQKNKTRCVITGEMSGISVLDFDDQSEFYRFLENHPEIENMYKVETKNGFHIYFLYNANIPQSVNIMHSYKGVDGRNNGGFVFAPPTKYPLLDGSYVEYKYLGGELMDCPKSILDELTINKPEPLQQQKLIFKNASPNSKRKNVTDSDDDDEPEVAKPKRQTKKTKVVEKEDHTDSESDKQLDDMSDLEKQDVLFLKLCLTHHLLNHQCNDYQSWVNVMFAIKHVCRKLATKTGRDYFLQFSKDSPKYDKDDCIKKYNSNAMSTAKKPLTIATIKKLAKENNPTEYAIIHNMANPKKPNACDLDKKTSETENDIYTQREESDEIIVFPDGLEKQFNRKYVQGVLTDLDAADLMYEMYPNMVTCNGIFYMYDFNCGLYSCNKCVIEKIVSCYSFYLHLRERKPKSTLFVKNPITSYGNNKILMEKIIFYLKSRNINDDWQKQTSSTSLGYILFPNGIFDFKTQFFFSKEKYGFNPKIVFYYKMPTALTTLDASDIEYMETIIERFFYRTLGKELADVLILNIARGWSGECMKRMIFAIGNSNCGKGIITSALQNALGCYVGTFNAESLHVQKTPPSDESAANRWMLQLCHKRIIIANESKGQAIPFDGNLIKKVASGGDTMSGRNHCQPEIDFHNQFLPILFANDMKQIIPMDDAVNGRLVVINFEKYSVIGEPQNDSEFSGDPTMMEETKTERFKKCLIAILLRSYCAFVDGGKKENMYKEVLKKSKNMWIDESDSNPMELFKKSFELTNNNENFISGDYISDWLKKSDLGISYKKLCREITLFCKTYHLDNIEQIQRSNNNKRIRGWTGIKYNKTYNHEDDPNQPYMDDGDLIGKI